MPLVWKEAQWVALPSHHAALPLWVLWGLSIIHNPQATSPLLGLHMSFLCQTL